LTKASDRVDLQRDLARNPAQPRCHVSERRGLTKCSTLSPAFCGICAIAYQMSDVHAIEDASASSSRRAVSTGTEIDPDKTTHRARIVKCLPLPGAKR